MLTIETRYLGPTDRQPSRVAAFTTIGRPSTGGRARLVMALPYDMAIPEAHATAARLLAEREGFAGHWQLFGETERGYLFGRLTAERPESFEVAAKESEDD